MAAAPDRTTLATDAWGAAGKEPVMNRQWAEFYAQERMNEFLREAAEARLAASTRRRRDEAPSKPGARAPKIVGRLLLRLRRATAS
jgi:fructosamine-3-kinase